MADSCSPAGQRLELGDLPLALRQAAAYISQNPTLGINEYPRSVTEDLETARSEARRRAQT
jgi:hypothetical protein